MERPEAEPKRGEPTSALDYQKRYGQRMMVLKERKGATAADDELCRILSVNTIAPDLIVTVQFLDRSSRTLRPEMLELAESNPAAN
jgi:hypothetical protein